MSTAKTEISVVPQGGFFVTSSGLSVFLSILISASVLIGIAIKLISRFNGITNDIRDLREDLNNHGNAEGHTKLLEQVRILQKELNTLDKRFDIHSQDYLNHKDTILLNLNGINEKINHKWQRTEDLYKDQKAEIKDLQKFLHKEQNFKIRE